jgi:hypothetical protein
LFFFALNAFIFPAVTDVLGIEGLSDCIFYMVVIKSFGIAAVLWLSR